MIQSSQDATLISRHVALKSGLPVTSTSLTLNILCGSGFQALIAATQQIQLARANLVLASGAENMTQVPFVLEDYLGQNNLDPLVGMNMPQTAELLAEKYGIMRDECDEYALESQKRWKKAKESRVFDAEVEPINVKRGKTEEAFDTDENPRETSLEKLGQLKPYVKKDGIVTAGNTSASSSLRM
ncbi:Protein F53A2.7 [Aphelenchoides avenae]|nr:Protein F53A2.7 [Aphelenchus avenae]